jgi:hypothetical protein
MYRLRLSHVVGVPLTQSGERRRWPKPEPCAYPSGYPDVISVTRAHSRGGDGAGRNRNPAHTGHSDRRGICAQSGGSDGGGCKLNPAHTVHRGHSDVTGVALAHSRGGDSAAGRNRNCAQTVHRALRRDRRGICAQSGGRWRWNRAQLRGSHGAAQKRNLRAYR